MHADLLWRRPWSKVIIKNSGSDRASKADQKRDFWRSPDGVWVPSTCEVYWLRFSLIDWHLAEAAGRIHHVSRSRESLLLQARSEKSICSDQSRAGFRTRSDWYPKSCIHAGVPWFLDRSLKSMKYMMHDLTTRTHNHSWKLALFAQTSSPRRRKSLIGRDTSKTRPQCSLDIISS